MLQRTPPELVLASASSARRTLLEAAGLVFTIAPAAIDEAAIRDAARAEGAEATEAALRLAELKAERVARRRPDALVIAADQILVCDGTWYDKPANLVAARAQLAALRGRVHHLATAVLCWGSGARLWHHIAAPRLTMRTFSPAFLDAYVTAEGERILTSVGAYRLEGLGVHLFDRIEGEHSAILGLPLLPLLGFLRQHGVLLG